MRYAPVLADDAPMFLGNRAHLFVVIGMSQEISEKLSAEVYREIVERRLPANLQLIPFDTLLANFESAMPPQIYILVPESLASVEQLQGPPEPAPPAERVLRTLIRTKFYVGGLPYSTTSDELRNAFAKAGTVKSVGLIVDKISNRSKGFAFVEMGSGQDAENAIEMWNDRDFGGRTLTVNEARPLEPRAPRGER